MAETQSSYDYIVEKFGEEKILKWSKWLYNLLSDFIGVSSRSRVSVFGRLSEIE